MKKITSILFTLSTDSIKDHRYRSVDDWWNPVVWPDQVEFETVTADTGNMDYNFCVLIHALVEQYLCYRNGITDEDVTGFDTSEYGMSLDDPGESKKAPYHKEHEVANEVERTVSRALGVVWPKYEEAIEKTMKKWKKK